MEIALVIEGMADRHREQPGEAEGRQPPHVPDHREAEANAQPCQHDSDTGVAGHMDGLEALQRPLVAALLHVPPRIVVVDYRGEREVIDRRRRGRRPFQRPAVPWIASYVAKRLAVAYTDVDLDEARQDNAKNQQGTECQ